ncbi:MAG: hypothetical protein ACI305_08740 [Lepagella sp.]
MKTLTKERQSLVDIALMTTGTTEGVWTLALRNGLSVTGALAYGTEIAYEGEDIEDARTASRYESEGICPATEVSAATLDRLLNRYVAVARPDFEEIKADEVKAQSTRAAVFSGEFTAAFS